MSQVPSCRRCGQKMRQVGRYADWTCECCDESVRCPHVSVFKRMMRKMAGRRT